MTTVDETSAEDLDAPELNAAPTRTSPGCAPREGRSGTSGTARG